MNKNVDCRLNPEVTDIIKSHCFHDWIIYHRNYGVDHFYIYDNGSDRDHPWWSSVMKHVEDGPYNSDASQNNKQIQTAHLNHAAHMLSYRTKWFGRFDIDEFVTPYSMVQKWQKSQIKIKMTMQKWNLSTYLFQQLWHLQRWFCVHNLARTDAECSKIQVITQQPTVSFSPKLMSSPRQPYISNHWATIHTRGERYEKHGLSTWLITTWTISTKVTDIMNNKNDTHWNTKFFTVKPLKWEKVIHRITAPYCPTCNSDKIAVTM